jgi:DNA-binding transcriptional ArsR family regulator
MRVMDLTRAPSALPVDVECSPAIDFLVELSAHSEPNVAGTLEVPEGTEDPEGPANDLSPELERSLESIGPRGGGNWGNLVGIARRSPAVSDVASLISRVEDTPADELWLIFAGYHIPTLVERVGRDTFEHAVRGGREDRAALVSRDGFCNPAGDDAWARGLIALDPEEMKTTTLDVLRRWNDEIYAPKAAIRAEVLERDAAEKRALARSLTPEKLIEVATNGLEWRPQPWIGRVILIPQVSMRPWNVMCADDDAYIICYPAADESFEEDSSAPPAALVRLHRALGDEKRLRMLKRLVEGPATLRDLADAAGLAKSTAHHHLVILRAAGLVLVTTDESSRYTLRRDPIPEASAMLQRFLAEPA